MPWRASIQVEEKQMNVHKDTPKRTVVYHGYGATHEDAKRDAISVAKRTDNKGAVILADTVVYTEVDSMGKPCSTSA